MLLYLSTIIFSIESFTPLCCPQSYRLVIKLVEHLQIHKSKTASISSGISSMGDETLQLGDEFPCLNMSDTSHTVLIQSTAQPQGQTEDHNIFQRRTNMTHTSLYHSLLSPSCVTPLLNNLIWNRFTKVQFVVHPTLRLTSRLTGCINQQSFG